MRQRGNAEDIISQKMGEIESMKFTLFKAVDEHEMTRKALSAAITERDILGTQMIRRNDEIGLLYEKIKIMQTVIARGEIQYGERQADLQLFRYKISELKSELKLSKTKASQIGGYQEEVIKLGNALQKERLQVKALSEELENPMNHHRWNQLKGTDPETFDLLCKVQSLQKRLIKKTEEVVEKESEVGEKEHLYSELKTLIARQPGPEVAEQLSIYQQNLKEKTALLKSMAAELNMFQA